MSKFAPKVSVIIPIYNVEKYLQECLESVVSQTLHDIEIICVNDGSPDGCGEILKEYAQKDERIMVINKENGGYGSACNMGLDKATGDYVAIVEPDDFIACEMYERLYALAKEHEVDIVKSCFFENYDTPNYKNVKKMHWSKNHNLPTSPFTIYEHSEFLYFHPSIWSAIYKRSFLNEHDICFVEAKGAGWTDNPFQVQTMCLAKSIFYTDDAYYFWRKQNLDEAKDLKDYTLPFVRSDEIHTWLEKRGISDKNVLNSLYERELAYLDIVFRMLKFSEIKNALPLIKKMYKRMGKPAPNVYFKLMKEEIRKMRKNIISVRVRKNERSFTLFGYRREF